MDGALQQRVETAPQIDQLSHQLLAAVPQESQRQVLPTWNKGQRVQMGRQDHEHDFLFVLPIFREYPHSTRCAVTVCFLVDIIKFKIYL